MAIAITQLPGDVDNYAVLIVVGKPMHFADLAAKISRAFSSATGSPDESTWSAPLPRIARRNGTACNAIPEACVHIINT